MGGYCVYGTIPRKSNHLGWLNLPSRNLFYDLLQDAGELSILWVIVVAHCSDDICMIFDGIEFELICRRTNTFLDSHTNWIDQKRVIRYKESGHWQWAKRIIEFFLEACSKRYEYIVFYDDFEVHDCGWLEPFSYLPRRREVTK